MSRQSIKALVVTLLAVVCNTGCTGSKPLNSHRYFQTEVTPTIYTKPSEDNHLSATINLSVQKMLDSQHGITANTTIAVADFVTLTANYDRPSSLGRYLSQAYLTALHKAGLSTVDYQITGSIRVTPNGNLGLSQDYLELANDVEANTVVVGTITPALTGYTINVRMVDNASKHVIAADQFFLTKKKVKESVNASL